MAQAAAPVLSIASAGFGLAGAMSSAQGYEDQAAGAEIAANAQSQGELFQSKEMTIAATNGQAQAAQTDAFMRRKLQSTLANIQAVRASAGTSSSSPTGAAVEASVAGEQDRERAVKVSNINAQSEADTAASLFYKQASANALLGGQYAAEGDEAAAEGAEMGGIGGLLKGIAGAVPGLSGIPGMGS